MRITLRLTRNVNNNFKTLLLVLLAGFLHLSLTCVYGSDSEQDLVRQLRIYKDALVSSNSEEIRYDAAVSLLLWDHPRAAGVITEMLTTASVQPARQAIVKAIVDSQAALPDKDIYFEPLVQMLLEPDPSASHAAAQALTIYDYEKAGPRLEELVFSQELDKNIRLNILYAMKLRSEKEAVSVLIKLLDDSSREIASEAENALQEMFGYPVGTERQVWESILRELPNKSRHEIMKDRLGSQLRRINELKDQLDYWQNLYLTTLENQYEQADEVSRGALIIDKLAAQSAPVKLWALGKIAKRSSATVLPEEKVRPVILDLIDDPDPAVRLNTAQVLSKMSELNPAPELLAQLQQEPRTDVQIALLEALGEAAYFALSPGSKIKLDIATRDQTLFWARKFAREDVPEQIARGINVMRKLLELNGFSAEQMNEHLNLIATRYEEILQAGDIDTASRILNEMARLCAHNGPLKSRCARRFGPAFKQAFASDNPLLQRAGLGGLANIDPLMALEEIRRTGISSKANHSIQNTLIELAQSVGSEADLEWLLAMPLTNGQTESAQQAVDSILGRESARTVLKWYRKMEQTSPAGRKTELLRLAEKAAQTEKDVEALNQSRETLVLIYLDTKKYADAVPLLKALLASVSEEPKRAELNRRLLEAGLQTGDRQTVADVLKLHLQKVPTGESDPMIAVLSEFFNGDAPSREAKIEMLTAMEGVLEPQENPAWASKIQQWKAQIDAAGKPEVVPAG